MSTASRLATGMALSASLFAMLISFPHSAFSNEMPEGLTVQQQMFGLICGKPEALRDELKKTHREVAVAGGLFVSGTQYVIYVNEDRTSFSFVIHKSDEQGCLVWSGEGEMGQAFMLNPEPQFPAKEAVAAPEWNS